MQLVCHDVLFAHWPVESKVLRDLLPEELTLDLYDGQAWLTIVAFRMTGVSLRGIPPMPALSSYAQVNLRTYVQADDDKPGTYLFSLDADSRIAAVLAPLMGFPFNASSIRIEDAGQVYRYQTCRHDRLNPAQLSVTYAPCGPPREVQSGTLDYFLTERYCMYGRHDLVGLFSIDLHHRPWPLQRSDVCCDCNTFAESIGIAVDCDPVAVHYAARQDMIAWPPERVVARSRSRAGSFKGLLSNVSSGRDFAPLSPVQERP